MNYTVTATYLSGCRTNRFAAILPGCDIAARRTHRITVISPGAGHIPGTGTKPDVIMIMPKFVESQRMPTHGMIMELE